MPEPLVVVIDETDAGARLDRVLAGHLAGLSRTRIKALILSGAVSAGGATISEPRYPVKSGQTITIDIPEPEPAAPCPETMDLSILYEDGAIIVINKPAGLVVHPGAGHGAGTLVNGLIAHCGTSLSGIGGVKRPGIVHRLDKDTSGVMVVAKTDGAHQALSAQFADHGRTGALERRYRAFVWGAPDRRTGTIDAPLGRAPNNPLKFAVRRDGKTAITHYRVTDRFTGPDGGLAASAVASDVASTVASAVECRLETGRTHQIRVHMAHMGHPLIADPVYGTGFATKVATLSPQAARIVHDLNRQALHAGFLRIEHPVTHEVMAFEAPLPDDLAALEITLSA